VLILAQNSCSVCVDRTIGQKSFWTYPLELLGDVDQVESHFAPLEIVLESVQDRCTVCAKHTIALEILLDAPDGTTR
jgi:hypothetical protein